MNISLKLENSMLSRSTINKSRVILICFILVGALAALSAYYLVQNYDNNASNSSLSQAGSFQIANLTITPFQATVEQPIVISADLVNLGNVQATYSLILRINDSVTETKELILSANESQLVSFTVIEINEGSYNVTLGDLTGIFSVSSKPTVMPSALKISNFNVNPTEAWPGQQVNMSVNVQNTGAENISYPLPFYVNGQVVQSVEVQLPSGASETVTAQVNESTTGTYNSAIGGISNLFTIVETGKHTLHYIASRDGLPFTLDGVSYLSPYVGLVEVGLHTFTVPATAQINNPGWGLTTYAFSSWNDGNTTLTKTIDIESEIYVTTNWVRLGSCPSLYVWNGTAYDYSAEVSDGAGWLGYLDHFQTEGTMVFSYNYPWDYIKLDSTQLQPLNGYYNMKIAEMSDEIFYLDQAKMIAIDHPIGTDVFSTTSTFIYNLTDQGTMYTVSTNPAIPLSAVDGQGQNVLPQISKMDGVFTSGTTWAWNNITLNLGDLSSAKEIKLVVGAKITWPTTSAGGNNFMKYANQTRSDAIPTSLHGGESSKRQLG